jgi:hypothetical protein
MATDGASGATVAAAVFGGVGSIAAAVGAGAAWRSANRSAKTSRDALEALGVAIKPALDATPMVATAARKGYTIRVICGSEWECRDIDVEAYVRDHPVITAHCDRLDKSSASDPFWVELPPPPPEFCQPGTNEPLAHHDLAHLEKVKVRYSDERHIIRYERTIRLWMAEDVWGAVIQHECLEEVRIRAPR